MQRRCLVYNRSDKHSEFSEADAGMVRESEKKLIRNADLVLYASKTLMETELSVAGERAHLLEHGVDLDRFGPSAGPEPDDLAAIGRPRIGFFGGLRAHLVDMQLLQRVAKEIPEAHMVLVGDAVSDIRSLTALPNVHHLGFKTLEQVPAYGAGFDVALMPYRDTEWIRNSNPIKVKEYLALGLEVVSTDFPEARRVGNLVHVARSGQEFVDLIKKILMRGRPDAERQAALRNSVQGESWDRKAEDLRALLENAP